jgi:hypothetical protein
MRYAAALAVLLGLAGLGVSSAEAGGMPAPWMNYHYPFAYPYPSYWHCGPYGIQGPTDRVPCYPVQGIGPPPFPGCHRGQSEPAMLWHRNFRSPRDFFMSPY